MMFHSTNKKAKECDIKHAILQGLAPDKGLYVPNEIPLFSEQELQSFSSLSYAEIAAVVFKKYLNDSIPREIVDQICKEAYDFDIPIEKLDEKKHILWLDCGPTLAFKDFAARAMARIMQYYLQDEKNQLHILTATSGDTGSAIANAFHNKENMRVSVLYPKGEITKRQRVLMTTLQGNISVIEVDGKFDDCQALVKEAFADTDLKNLGSANSINFARLMPQIVYYVYAASRLGEITVCVPCGNFGNLMGGLLAKKMGTQIKKFVVAMNQNNAFESFYKTATYEKITPSKNCISNAMNVGHPSNLSRLIELYGGQMNEKGVIKTLPDMEKIKEDIWAASVTDEQTTAQIKKTYDEYGVVIEPHGAVALNAYEKYVQETNEQGIGVCLETADPAKFPEHIRESIGVDPTVPKVMSEALEKREKIRCLGKSYKDFKEYLLE